MNKTFNAVGIPQEKVGPAWRLRVKAGEESRAELTREELLDMDLVSAKLPIACVEGWSTTQTWTGVRLADLAGLAGVEAPPRWRCARCRRAAA